MIETAPRDVSDRRGNRLPDFQITTTVGGRSQRIYLHANRAIANQVKRSLGGSWSPLTLRAGDRGRWTDRIHVPGKVTPEIRRLLALLREVLTLEITRDLDLAIALDFYKTPDDELPPDQWPNTEVGDLINRGKYHREPTAAELAGRMAHVCVCHPAYRAASRVIAVPGTEHDYGEKLAGELAHAVHIPLACAERMDGGGPAKSASGDTSMRFHIDTRLAGTVIIADDVYWTGGTMNGVARAARAAGASTVLGLVGARNLRLGR